MFHALTGSIENWRRVFEIYIFFFSSTVSPQQSQQVTSFKGDVFSSFESHEFPTSTWDRNQVKIIMMKLSRTGGTDQRLSKDFPIGVSKVWCEGTTWKGKVVWLEDRMMESEVNEELELVDRKWGNGCEKWYGWEERIKIRRTVYVLDVSHSRVPRLTQN